MLSSRGCLQLLLGWALLLGQSVGGTDEVAEAEVEAEAELPSSSEAAEEVATSEEALDEPYVDDDIWFMDPWSASEEQLEKMASMEHEILKQPGNHYTHIMREIGMSAMHKTSQGPFYKLLEDADLHIKKAIGSVSTFTLFVGATNCSRAQGVESRFSGHHYDIWYRRMPKNNLSKPKCTLEPGSLTRSEGKLSLARGQLAGFVEECGLEPGDSQIRTWHSTHKTRMEKCKIYVYTDGETGTSSVFHTDCEYFMMVDEEPQVPLD